MSLPPANEVLGKVMFLQLSVILSVHRGGRERNSPLGGSQVDGTHPTGMHSCINVILQKTLNITSIPMMAAGAAQTPSSSDQVRYSNFQN